MQNRTNGLNSNALKLIAILAMTIDHFTSVLFPGYPTDWWILCLHMIGRITAPIMWFFIAEGYHYTRDLKKYAGRLFLFAVISHFAYNFAFGIPFVPFRTTVFNQTSVIWALAWGLVALAIADSPAERFPMPWVRTALIVGITVLAFCADWSSIAVLAIVEIGTHRGDFRRQMTGMVGWVALYALVYFFFIDRAYGVLQMFVVLSIPLLRAYNGERGRWKGMKWLFYCYYPAHLVACGVVRLLLHGNIGVIIGG